MYRHPFASAVSPLAYDYSEDDSASSSNVKRKPPEQTARPSTAIGSRCDAPAKVVMHKKSSPQFAQRPLQKMTMQDSNFTLVLNGQENSTGLPTYGRGATVDGTISLSNLGSITKVMAKIEGHMIIEDLGGSGTLQTTVLTENLVAWDAPNRLGGYSNEPHNTFGVYAPVPGHCPPSFTFKTTLPTHFKDAGGELSPLPPSYTETLPGVPGFRCEVKYTLSITVTRARDVRKAQWRKNTTFRTQFEYRPRTRPSQSPPFRATSSKNKSSPVTKFFATIESGDPFTEPVQSLLYLPNSQVTPICSPIPFYLKLSGPEAVIDVYTRPPLSSFLPRAKTDNLASIRGAIQQQFNAHFIPQSQKLARALTSGFGASQSSLTRMSSRSSSSSHGTHHYKLKSKSNSNSNSNSNNTQPYSSASVLLVRQVSVDNAAFADTALSLYQPDNESETENLLGDIEGHPRGHVHKSTVIGEGLMYTSHISRGSVTWAGEIRVNPRVKCCGFQTRNLVVRDMLIVSIREASSDSAPSHEFRQIIPVQLTTDACS